MQTYRHQSARQVGRSDCQSGTAQPLPVRVHGDEVCEYHNESEDELDTESLPRVEVCRQMGRRDAKVAHVAGDCHPATQQNVRSP